MMRQLKHHPLQVVLHRQSLITQETQWTTVVPSSIQSLYTTPHLTKEDTFSLIKYHILSHSIHEMAHIYTISEGLEHRLKNISIKPLLLNPLCLY